ncbi:MAG: PTS transporter subunit EIIB [Elusimicrobiota bacterium]|jgi:phosphotransferase system IIB component|nr:PTS transporter subunit EIIB [Elusimicrobiota bacterium]
MGIFSKIFGQEKEIKNPIVYDEPDTLPVEHELHTAQQYVFAMGGKENIISANFNDTRIIFEVADNKKIDEIRARRLGAKGLIKKPDGKLHLLIGQEAQALDAQIKEFLRSPNVSI